ncbi:hypothetical protein LQ318_08435 [Aliifodinibius salicampi]|uniref:Uncharacterized protein n=1 Tax=Fodinibius salicampi TaxID=1920655 RepID=A0ABT3PYI8_9BACT|nr:hypothetical protein [Fodinibius salicampi]MCW9712930.1 hypothetical protein [Fodinibius salicampi]
MRVDFLILCRSSSIDASTGSLSLFDIVEEITAEKEESENEDSFTPPEINFSIQAIANFTREESDGKGVLDKEFVLQLENPQGDAKIIREDLPVRFEENHKRFRLRVTINITIQEEGQYFVRLLDENKKQVAMNDIIFNIKEV